MGRVVAELVVTQRLLRAGIRLLLLPVLLEEDVPVLLAKTGEDGSLGGEGGGLLGLGGGDALQRGLITVDIPVEVRGLLLAS
jgi:hypothetical protein